MYLIISLLIFIEGSKGGAVVGAIAFHQCGLGLNPLIYTIILWVEFVVGSLHCSERFFSGYSSFLLSSKTNICKFKFDQESGRWRTTIWMCYLKIIIYCTYLLDMSCWEWWRHKQSLWWSKVQHHNNLALALSHVNCCSSFIRVFQDEVEAYGIDWDGPLPQEPADSTVSVPETQSVLSDQEMQSAS